MVFIAALLVTAAILGVAGRAPAAEPAARVRVFDPPESVSGPSRTGFVPPPGDFSHLRPRETRSLAALPVRFDWRDAGVSTPVLDQGNCGCCYAIAAVGNFESAILIDGGPYYDFSENNVKECDWWANNSGLASCNGGNASMVVSFLSQEGIALETCDPFDPRNRTCKEGCPYYFSVTGWLQISGDEIAETSALKDHVYNYGPMFVAMVAANGLGWPGEFSGYDGSYTLFYEGLGDLDHAVMIVGWDDTLSHAGGQGAWIVKNSWGDDWGEDGYFYIAYGSAGIGSYASTIYDWQPYDTNGRIFFRDDAGFMGTALGYETNTAWAFVKYVPDEPVRLEQVEFWTTDTATDIDVFIYDGFNDHSLLGELAREENITVENYGYHSIPLSSPVEVSATNDFYVAIKITNSSYQFPIALDNWGPTEAGNCYVSPNGSSWTDVTEVAGCTPCTISDVCLRVRGTSMATGGVLRVPDEYGTIAAAIVAADAGDTVLVGPGTYNEGTLVVDEDIVLMGEAGPESTVVDAAGLLAAPASHTTVLSLVGVTNACVVSGLTLMGAESAASGGGIVMTNSSASIVECVITANSAVAGAGIMAQASSPFIINCTVADNSGLAGIHMDAASSGLISKCIVSGTTGGPGIYCGSAAPSVACCDLYGNVGTLVGGTDGGGNFMEDPMYCDRFERNFLLQDVSPCVAGYGCGRVGALDAGCGSQVPAALTYFVSNPGDASNRLIWTLPGGPVKGAYIVYKTTGYPSDWTDGTAVENGMYGFFGGEPAASDTFDHTGLTNGVTYYYAAYAYNGDYKSTSGLLDSATPVDNNPPGQVEYFSAQSGDSVMVLSWTFPPDEDLEGVLIRYSTSDYPSLPTDGSPVENGSDGVFLGDPGNDTVFVHAGLDNGVTYLYSAFSFDAMSNYSDPVNAGGTPGVDDTPPGEVRSFAAEPSDSTVTLSWLNPGETDFDHTLVRYSTASYPGTPQDGLAVENGNGGIFPAEPASADTFVHAGLTNGTMVYYTAFTADTIPNYSSGASVFARPQDGTPPAPVTGLTATPGDAAITLRWTNPQDADFTGVRIMYSTTSYPAGPMDGEVANIGGTPAPVDSFVHTGLLNGTTYYYSVFASDEVPNYSEGASASAAPVDQTPPVMTIWVLRNPYLSNYLDIYLLASEALLLDSLRVTVGDDAVGMETADSDEFVYRGDYDLYSTGNITIRARARDISLNPGSAERQFSSSFLVAASGGAVRSVDGTFGLEVPAGAAPRDAYVLVWDSAPEAGVLSAYEVSPGYFDLGDYARVEFAYGEEVSDPEYLGITLGVGDGAVKLDSYVDEASSSIVAYTRGLGVFSLTRQQEPVSRPAGDAGVTILHNTPNPFAHATEIAYHVSRGGSITIEIIGIDGRVVKSLHRGGVTAGRHSIGWDGTDGAGARVASGIYFVRVITPSGVAGRKIAVLR
jgi:C1A family cysteine protease